MSYETKVLKSGRQIIIYDYTKLDYVRWDCQIECDVCPLRFKCFTNANCIGISWEEYYDSKPLKVSLGQRVIWKNGEITTESIDNYYYPLPVPARLTIGKD